MELCYLQGSDDSKGPSSIKQQDLQLLQTSLATTHLNECSRQGKLSCRTSDSLGTCGYSSSSFQGSKSKDADAVMQGEMVAFDSGPGKRLHELQSAMMMACQRSQQAKTLFRCSSCSCFRTEHAKHGIMGGWEHALGSGSTDRARPHLIQ